MHDVAKPFVVNELIADGISVDTCDVADQSANFLEETLKISQALLTSEGMKYGFIVSSRKLNML